jgi:Spy/CpxP family protein refolding chaperone
VAATRLIVRPEELTFLQAPNKPGQRPASILLGVAVLRSGRRIHPAMSAGGGRTMKKALAGVLGVAVVAAGFALLTGFRGGGCGHGHGGRDPARMAAFVTDHVDDALDDLEATPEQRQRIHAVKDRLLERGQALRAGKGDTHAELLAQWKAESPDRARLHAMVDERIEAMRAFAHEAVDGAAEVHATLTPEQRAEVTRKMERRMERWSR